MPSIVDPASDRNGASTVTRGLLHLVAAPPLGAQVEVVAARSLSPGWRRLRQARSLLGSEFSDMPSKVAYVCSRSFRRAVERRLNEGGFQLIVLNGGDLLGLMPYLPPGVPHLVVAHNVEHDLFRSQISSLRRMLRPMRYFLERDSHRLERFERQGLRAAVNVIFLSCEDAAWARGECLDLNTLVVPPVFDYEPVELRTRAAADGLDVGLIGNFGWWPNRDSLRWFLERILPYTNAEVRLHLFGKYSESALGSHPRVLKHGSVGHFADIWSACDFLVCPVVSGGGVSVKFAEAVYNRMPVLATPRAARGLPLASDPAIVLLEGPQQWVDFLNSRAARVLGSRRVSAAVAETFSPKSHREAFQRFIKSVVTCNMKHADPKGYRDCFSDS
jgi:hypothetical protein